LIKSVSRCPHCSAPRYTITKDKANPIVLYRETKDDKKMTIRVELFNHHIKRVFERITEDTLTHMGIPFESPPKNCIRSVIEVAPNTIRPDIKQTSGNRLSMNDLTILLKTVVDINISLPEQIPPDEQIGQIQKERYYALELAYASYIGSGSQMSLSVNSRETKSIIKRLKGKESTARANLLGKRCNNMMRSVITGDPTLRLDEVGIPEEYAVKIGIPETVNERNYEKMLVYFNNGVEKYPGCKHIVKKSTGEKYNRAMLGTYQLQIGDKVYRNLINGDYVLFNRQPSLIYSSVSAMRVKIIDGMTIRINPLDCVTFNADFRTLARGTGRRGRLRGNEAHR
jgi:DNA-directed RNA polymerase beta' subunit